MSLRFPGHAGGKSKVVGCRRFVLLAQYSWSAQPFPEILLASIMIILKVVISERALLRSQFTKKA